MCVCRYVCVTQFDLVLISSTDPQSCTEHRLNTMTASLSNCTFFSLPTSTPPSSTLHSSRESEKYPQYKIIHVLIAASLSFSGYPGGYFRVGRARLEECSAYGCLLELTIQYGIIMIGKQALNNGVELGIP